jgi:1-acyl-sn-glycerol-3-phosphate acyltransferase
VGKTGFKYTFIVKNRFLTVIKLHLIFIFVTIMKLVGLLAKFCFSIYVVIIFTTFLLVIFPIVVVASFFGDVRGGNIIYMLCKIWASVLFFFCQFRVKHIFEMHNDISHAGVFVFNHISLLDIPVIMKALPQHHFRILGKAELAKIPVFGFLYRKAVVMVERSNAANRAKSVQLLKSFLNKNISVVISPEGTFNTTHQPLKDFYDGAFKIAIETNTPIVPLLFLDTYDRMPYQSILLLNPGRCRIVHLPPIAVSNYTIENVAVLKQLVYQTMQAALIKYKASWIIKNN